MSVDKLQQKIRKLKNPLVVDLTPIAAMIPPQLKQIAESETEQYRYFCNGLLEGLKGVVPAVRFQMGIFALMGPEGLTLLKTLMENAKKQDFYVLLDVPESLSAQAAELVAKQTLQWSCDGMIVSAYSGSDTIKPFLPLLDKEGKSLFVVLRTANRSASELQDLMTGTRLVHIAAADTVSRLGEPLVGRCGYSQLAGVAAANAAESLRTLRCKYNRLFLLIDGLDYSNANAKNCSCGFDQFGHGAAVCAGASVTAAWTEAPGNGTDYVTGSVEAAQRIQKNLLRYITVL
ncbi:MAG: hypothetical protein IJO04_02920 [Oscillospiraceae bacterium]|nr:hypothetical protein [Oscillospiraceae bacterium]